jgi:peptidoglycan/LPS O-acetylase OafA/YrhL
MAALIGLAMPGIASTVGAGLVVYAVALLWNASRTRVSRGEIIAAVALNALWVAGSAVVIVDGPLTPIGKVAVAAVAAAVLVFAVLEIMGLRNLRDSRA